jgi:hypothetical protein
MYTFQLVLALVVYNYLVKVLHPAMIVLYFPDVHHGPADIYLSP